MIEDLESGQRDAVIVSHLDRLTRRPVELERFLVPPSCHLRRAQGRVKEHTHCW